MQRVSFSKLFFIYAAGFFLILSLIFGGLYFSNRDGQNNKKYPLLANRLFLEKPSDVVVNFEPLRKQVNDYFDKINISHSFYFEYLFTGSNIRNGENNQLVGASLMKIPIVMDLYKAAELGKISVDREVTVPANATNANDPQFGSTAGLKPGDKIKLRDAAKIALAESDNTAAYTVFNSTLGLLTPDQQSINNLDIATQIKESNKGPYALISASSYASFLRCLYFSCFLSFSDSQLIMNDLVNNSTDNSRIRAGVPADIKVARKIGSFSTVTQSDCGVVYVPNRRYLLCVMLDEDDDAASAHIKAISEMVYSYVASLK